LYLLNILHKNTQTYIVVNLGI